MSRLYFFGLMQLIIAINGQPAWGAVLATSPDMVRSAVSGLGNLPPANAVCCDPQFEDANPEGKIIVAQIFDLITGAAKLIYNATDNTKEKEEAAKAAELQRLAEEKAKTDEQNKILKAKELDELKRQSLSNPFDVADNPPAIDKPVQEVSKKQLIDIPQAGATGNSPSPATNSQNSATKEVAVVPSQEITGAVAVEQSQAATSAVPVTSNVAQAAAPLGQAAAAGSTVAVPAAQIVTPVEQVATSAGASAVPVTHSTALADQVSNAGGQIPATNVQAMVAVTQAAAGQVVSPPVQSAAPTIQAAAGQIAPQVQTPAIQTPVSAAQTPILNNSQIVAPVVQLAPAINGVGAQAGQVSTPVDSGRASGAQGLAAVAPVAPAASVVPAPVSNVAAQESLQKNRTTGQLAVQDSLPNKSAPNGNADTEKTAISARAIQPEKISPPVNSAAPIKKSDNPFEN